jgi:hypothetical protein
MICRPCEENQTKISQECQCMNGFKKKDLDYIGFKDGCDQCLDDKGTSLDRQECISCETYDPETKDCSCPANSFPIDISQLAKRLDEK